MKKNLPFNFVFTVLTLSILLMQLFCVEINAQTSSRRRSDGNHAGTRSKSPRIREFVSQPADDACSEAKLKALTNVPTMFDESDTEQFIDFASLGGILLTDLTGLDACEALP
jgi:hypothetical protein